ncbi:MAG: hypothetical protein CMC79_03635 [Flavobacteriaceae bacterium]|nr:hypothetical protein [Flavobacteriaceae bacterium]|tara:strand:- start:37839 stop:38534 length:696 start_codon:yes stop_codon:yes gene_type:complete
MKTRAGLSFIYSLCAYILIAQNSKSIEIKAFNEIFVYSGIEVKLFKSNKNNIIVKGKDAAAFIVSQKNKSLNLRSSIDKRLALDKIQVELYFQEDINKIILNQGSSAFSNDTLKQTHVQIKLLEGSRLSLFLETEKTKAEVFSGSSLEIMGTSTSFDLFVGTGGISTSDEFVANQAKVKTRFGGIAYVKSKILMDATASFYGIIRVYGNPQKFIWKKSIGGKIRNMEKPSN